MRDQAARPSPPRPSAARPTARPRPRRAGVASAGRSSPSPRPPSFSASVSGVPPTRRAGTTPARMPVRIDAPSTNSRTRAVDRDLVGTRHLVGEQRRAGAQARPRRAAGRPHRRRAPSTSDSTSSCCSTRAAAGAERGADRHLLAAAEGAREQQVADVGAGDQQHQADGGEQHHERRADVADDVLLQRAPASRPSRRSPPDTPAPAAWRSPPARDRASSAPTPGCRRATTCRLWFSRTARSSPVSASGTHRSRDIGNQDASEAAAGITPTIV